MKSDQIRNIFRGCLAAALAALGTNYGLSQANAAPQTRAAVEDGVQVLTRGPVHEGFAVTVTFDPEPGIIVPRMPPESIEELPPEQRPEGENVAWIPGYFAWDDERDDFMWVSGIWRDLPPGRQWVPGYWTETTRGSQWISGYWADAALTEIRYLPEPPATVEAGPNIEAPSANHTWLPGSWIWHQDRYAWRPGYWAPMQPDWDWVPAHYVWSPRGYVFVDGYNDYSVARRGVLFAPVYFSSAVYSRRGFSYSPSTIINPGVFMSHLFSRPRYNHYYFGDYYAADYGDAGFYPWYSYSSSGFGYDPFYARQRWQHRENRDWQQRIETDFAHRRDNEAARPPRTLAALTGQQAKAADADDTTSRIAMSLQEFTTSQKSTQKFQLMDQDERQRMGQRGQEIGKYRQARQQLEAAKATPTSAGNADSERSTKAEQVKLTRSPIAAQSDAAAGRNVKLPVSQDAPEIDLNVKPEPRVTRETRRVPGAKKNAPDVSRDDRNPAKKSGKSMEKKAAEPARGKKEAPAPDRPKVAPQPDRPKVDPRPDRPEVDPKPDRPKVDPAPGRPKADPKPDLPKADPAPERPKVDPKPDLPKVDPAPDRPRVDPKPDRPKVDPVPDRPKVDPKPDVP